MSSGENKNKGLKLEIPGTTTGGNTSSLGGAQGDKNIQKEIEKTKEELKKEVTYSKKYLFVLFLIYWIFLIIGAFIFSNLEYSVVEHTDKVDHPVWVRLKEGSSQNATPTDEDFAVLACPKLSVLSWANLTASNETDITAHMQELCSNLTTIIETKKISYHWTWIDALYFSMTTATTIGYGYHSPTTAAAKVACMLYALVGVPLTGLLLATTSSIMGEKVFRVYKTRLQLSGEQQRSRLFIFAASVMYATFGFVIFIFLPAIPFMVIENWSYLDSVYFAFITLSTIGYGDLVSGKNMESQTWLVVYQVSVIFWITCSLGYWVAMVNFITKAMRWKKLHTTVMIQSKLLKMKLLQQNRQKHPSGQNSPSVQAKQTSLNLATQLNKMLNMSSSTLNLSPSTLNLSPSTFAINEAASSALDTPDIRLISAAAAMFAALPSPSPKPGHKASNTSINTNATDISTEPAFY